jgi:hypothetical protein
MVYQQAVRVTSGPQSTGKSRMNAKGRHMEANGQRSKQ